MRTREHPQRCESQDKGGQGTSPHFTVVLGSSLDETREREASPRCPPHRPGGQMALSSAFASASGPLPASHILVPSLATGVLRGKPSQWRHRGRHGLPCRGPDAVAIPIDAARQFWFCHLRAAHCCWMLGSRGVAIRWW